MKFVKSSSVRPSVVAIILAGSVLSAHAGTPAVIPPAIPAPPAVNPQPAASPALPVLPVPPARTSFKIPEGTEIRVQIDDPLSSKTSSAGDMFAFRTTEAVHLADGTVIPEGYRGRGEVTDVEKKGMLGKPGRLNIRLDYIRIGDVHLHLRRSTGMDGKSGVGTTVALALIVSPLFLMHHGAEAVIPKGQAMTVFVDEDTEIPLPLSPPHAD